MVGKKRRKDTRKILIRCQWRKCNSILPNVMEMNKHLSNHLKNNPKSSTPLRCYWSDCLFVVKEDECDELDLKRHVFYHGYFQALLTRGKYECQSNPEIPSCNAAAWTWEKIPPLKNDFSCQWGMCTRHFTSIIEFHDHIEQHANFEYEMLKTPDIQKRKVQCCWSYCEKKNDNRYRLIEHVAKHSLKKLMACHHCGELFRCRTNLFDHLRRQPENNTNKNQCAQCFKFFATDKLFRAHVLTHVNCYKCTLCDMTCSSANALSIHIRYRHLKDKPIKCNECEYRCVRKWDLEKHKQGFHRKEMLRCTIPGCSYAVRSYYLLKRHTLEIHKDRPFIYMCHCCERLFKSGKSMSSHLIRIHNYSLPSGHKRFIYRIDENGFYRLATTRIESQEVTEQILTTSTQVKSDRFESDSALSLDISSVDKISENNEKLIKTEQDDNTTVNNYCFAIVTNGNDILVSKPIILSTDDKLKAKAKASNPAEDVVISSPFSLT